MFEPIIVYEHQSLFWDKEIDGVILSKTCYEKLEKHFGSNGKPYFSLIRNGIKFNEFVGVIQVGDIQIHVLPKADRQDLGKEIWKKVLLGMLKRSSLIEIKNAGNSQLSFHSNSILDLYFELFLNEIEYLLYNGLMKKYNKIEKNVSSLKGNLLFSKHISKNLTHQERFLTRHVVYDTDHLLHQIILQTLLLLKRINHNPILTSRIASAILWFPETKAINVNATHFERIVLNRKTKRYENALQIAKMLLLNFHPDINNGMEDVIALMFNMSLLWEKFIYASLKPLSNLGYNVSEQTSRNFWTYSNNKYSTKIRPDIVISSGENNFVLDTKWKNLYNQKPSSQDLQQMFSYHEYFKASKVALIYPGKVNSLIEGEFDTRNLIVQGKRECSIMPISVDQNLNQWQEQIRLSVLGWVSISSKV